MEPSDQELPAPRVIERRYRICMMMPDTHMDPINAAGRFVLELIAAYGIGAGIRRATDSWTAAGAVVLIALVMWARFRVPGDPGPAPRPVPGVVRLAIEAVILGGGGIGLLVAHGATPSSIYFVALGAHYATTPRRIRHLLSYRGE